MKWVQYCTVMFTSPSLLIFQVNFVKLQLTTTNRDQTLKRQLHTRAGCCLPSQKESCLLLPEGTDFHTSTSLLLERGCLLEYQHQRHIRRGWTCLWSDPSLRELVHHRGKKSGRARGNSAESTTQSSEDGHILSQPLTAPHRKAEQEIRLWSREHWEKWVLLWDQHCSFTFWSYVWDRQSKRQEETQILGFR